MSLNSHIGFKFVRKIIRIGLIFTIFISNMSCSNQFTGFADKTTDQSLLYTAIKGVRNADYAGAITACSFMSAGFSASADVAMICASAYAGSCGFNTFDMIADISGAAAPVFKSFLTTIISSTPAQIADCDSAVSIMRDQGAASVRSDDQNSFMVLVSLWEIAMIANEVADTNEDNAFDGGDVCADIPTATFDQELATAFWELYKSLSALQTNAYYGPIFTVVDNLCTALGAIGQNFCIAADPMALTAGELDGTRTLLKEGAVLGLDQCGGGGTLPACKCP